MSRNIQKDGFAAPEWRDALLSRMARTARERLLDRRADLYDQLISNELRRIGVPGAAVELLVEQERRDLHDIDRALERIADGRWGLCERCDGPIGLQRLTALPEVSLCLHCADA